MSQFEVRARLKVRDGQLEGFKRQAAEVMRQAREKDTGTLAYDWFSATTGRSARSAKPMWMRMPSLSTRSTSAKRGTSCLPNSPMTTRWPSTATRRLDSSNW